MQRFGFKIVDRNPDELVPIVDYALRHEHPLEVGLFFNDTEALEMLAQRLDDAAIAINAHTNHERFHVLNLHRTSALLERHIRQAQGLGSAYSVLHTAYMPLPMQPSRRQALMGMLLDNLERAEEVCVRCDYRLHLENIYHPLAFYYDLMQGIHARGLRRIHFCFDIGHAKVWSGSTLDDWMAFLGDLEDAGFGLHFHLHGNRGFSDEHLSMAEVEAFGIAGADDDYNPYGYPAAYWAIASRFPDAVKVFEVKNEYAIANMETVMAYGASRLIPA